jgi:hypothetical protein
MGKFRLQPGKRHLRFTPVGFPGFRLSCPSQPSSQKAVSAIVLTSSHKGRLICARGTSPLARLCYRSSVEERLFGSAIQRRGRTQHYALSYCPRQKAVEPYLSAGALMQENTFLLHLFEKRSNLIFRLPHGCRKTHFSCTSLKKRSNLVCRLAH